MTSSEHTRATEHEHEKAGSPSAAAHVLESRPIPRAGDYEAQYFDTKETPNLVAISRIGNPTGLAVVSFSTSLTIIGLALLQISDITLTSSFGAVGVYTYIGGVGMLLSAIFEIIVGNSFGFVVFATFAGYWFSLASLFTTGFGVAANTAAAGAIGPILQSQGVGFWQITFVIIDTIFLIVSLKTNVVFVAIFTTLWPLFLSLAVLFTNTGLSPDAQVAWSRSAGAFGLITAVLGWYLLLAILAAEVGHGFKLPVGDLSQWGKKKEVKHDDVSSVCLINERLGGLD